MYILLAPILYNISNTFCRFGNVFHRPCVHYIDISYVELRQKVLSEGYVKMPRKNASYQQSIRIFYKFIGEIVTDPIREFTPGSQDSAGASLPDEFNM